MVIETRLQELLGAYGDGRDGSAPTPAQWRTILSRDPDAPITLINFFKFRAVAVGADAGVSGMEAFGRYAAVSAGAVAEAGAELIKVGAFAGLFAGEDEDWDMVAIGSYPNLKSLLTLLDNPAYRTCYDHRRNGCERQKVLIATA